MDAFDTSAFKAALSTMRPRDLQLLEQDIRREQRRTANDIARRRAADALVLIDQERESRGIAR